MWFFCRRIPEIVYSAFKVFWACNSIFFVRIGYRDWLFASHVTVHKGEVHNFHPIDADDGCYYSYEYVDTKFNRKLDKFSGEKQHNELHIENFAGCADSQYHFL